MAAEVEGGSGEAPFAGASPRRPSASRVWPLLVVGLGLLMLGAGGLAAAAGVTSTPTIGPNVALNAGARDPADLRQHNSPSIVSDPEQPRHLAVVNRIDNPLFGCALHVSTNAGASWRDRRIPFPEGEEAPARCYAPDAAFGAGGVLHVSFVTLAGRGNTPSAVWVSSSPDLGRSFSTPTRVAGPLAFQVRLVADAERPQRLYLTWLQASAVGSLLFPEAGNPLVVSRSDDGGRTWGGAVRVSPPRRARVVAPTPAVGSGNRLFVAYLDLGADALDYHGGHEGRGGEPYPGPWSLVLARSGDGGATWSEAVVAADVVPAQRFVVFLPPTPSLVVDGPGRRVHVAFTDARLGDADVWVWTSADGGASFSPPRRVNDTRPRDNTSQYLPSLALAPDGRLDVVYYDRRADAGTDLVNRVSLQSSRNGGRTFGGHVTVSDRAFDSGVGFGSERGLPDLGSRLGLLSSPRRALAVWTDTRGGTPASGKQDLAAASVTFPGPRRGVAVLRALGCLLVAGGLVVVAGALRRRLSPPPSPPPGG